MIFIKIIILYLYKKLKQKKMENYDDWKQQTPDEDFDNHCDFCGENCEKDFCDEKCKRAYDYESD